MAASGLRLLMRQGPRPDHVFEVDKPVVVIGREAGNDIVVEDPQVSRHHARLSLQAGGYVVEDLGSTNGTYINGRRVTTTTPVNPGDTLGLGDTVVFLVEGVEGTAGETVVGRSQQPATLPPMGPPASFSSAPAGPPAPPPPPPPSFGQPSGPSFAPPPPPQPSGSSYAPPPPPAPEKKGPSCWVWGCGCLVLLFIGLLVLAFLVYQFAPPSVAGPICDIFGQVGLGSLCR